MWVAAVKIPCPQDARRRLGLKTGYGEITDKRLQGLTFNVVHPLNVGPLIQYLFSRMYPCRVTARAAYKTIVSHQRPRAIQLLAAKPLALMAKQMNRFRHTSAIKPHSLSIGDAK